MRLPSLEVALIGAVIVVAAFVWESWTPRTWDHNAPVYILAMVSGWSLIVIGWIGRIANEILERFEQLRDAVARSASKRPPDGRQV